MAKRTKKDVEGATDADALYAEIFASTGWVTAAQKIRPVRAVPTIMYGFDWASGVGGWPVDRVSMIYGPSSAGKSLFVLALIRSFVDRKFLAALIDSERTTDLSLATAVIGRALDTIPNWRMPAECQSLTDAQARADELFAMARKLAKSPTFGGDFAALLVVDTITKLVTTKELGHALGGTDKQVSADVENMEKGHLGRYAAAQNGYWLNRLVPQADESHTGVLLVSQERSYTDAMGNQRQRHKGGDALFFDSSLVIRVFKGGGKYIKVGDRVIGSEHEAQIVKSKFHALEEGRCTKAPFFFSNGNGPTPKGIDVWRDMLVTCSRPDVGIITPSGSAYEYEGRRWTSTNRAVAALYEDAGLFAEIDAEFRRRELATRSKRRYDLVEVVDDETGEVAAV